MKAISLKIKWTWRKQENKKETYRIRMIWGASRWNCCFLSHISLSWLLILTNKKTALATQGTDKVTAKITYVLLVKIITDEPIKSPNFYRWLSKKAPKKHWTWHFFISFLLHSLYIWKQRTFLIGYIFEKWLIFKYYAKNNCRNTFFLKL